MFEGDIMNKSDLLLQANQVRKGILTAIYHAKSGHPGGSLSIADILTYLYFEEMNVDPQNPHMEERDRLVLSKGHTAPALYATLANRGYFPVDELKTLRQVGSRLQGHPCMSETPGVDMSTGSLGQGLSAAVGMALAAKMDGKDYRTYCICGDGELQEGQIWEAAMFAGHHKLDNLLVLIDNNGLQIDGTIEEVCSQYPIAEKWKSFQFEVFTINGNDMDEIALALGKAKTMKEKPTAIILETKKGKGVSFMENNVGWHGKAPDENQYIQAMNELQNIEMKLGGTVG